MDFTLSKETSFARQMFRDFAQNEIKPYVKQMDEEEKLYWPLVEKMGQLGIFAIAAPVEYGGSGSNHLTSAICVEELSKVCPALGGLVSIENSLIIPALTYFGTDEQKEKYLPDLIKGKTFGTFSLTEPGAGSDAAGQQTLAVDMGDHYLLNGSKIFASNASFASIFIVACMTDKSKGVKGISTLIIEKGTEGFSIGKTEELMGLRAASPSELIFDNCVIPKANLLGREGKGFNIFMNCLDGGRLTIAAQAIGIAQGAIDETIKYVKERKQFGKTISFFQNTQFKLAEMQTKTDAARLMLYNSACLKDSKENYSRIVAEAKLFASEVANDVTRSAVQLFGGYGYTREYPVERLMRDAKITEIYEGTSEVQKMVISGLMGIK